MFHVRKFVIDKSVVPSYVPSGLYRIEALIELDDAVMAGVTIVLRVK